MDSGVLVDADADADADTRVLAFRSKTMPCSTASRYKVARVVPQNDSLYWSVARMYSGHTSGPC